MPNLGSESNVGGISSHTYEAQLHAGNDAPFFSASGHINGKPHQGCDFDAVMEAFTHYGDRDTEVNTRELPAPEPHTADPVLDNSVP
jgi:hypothetical protein